MKVTSRPIPPREPTYVFHMTLTDTENKALYAFLEDAVSNPKGRYIAGADIACELKEQIRRFV